jgi:soluble lytic murein transglycosylase-like protein
LTFTIVIDEAVIRSNDRRISMLKTDTLMLTKGIYAASQEIIIYEALRSFSGNKLTEQASSQLAKLVYENSVTYGYDPYLLLAVIQVESMFHASARGVYKSGEESGAYGFMQIKLETAQEIARSLGMNVVNIRDLFKPEINVAVGVAYLSRLIAGFHSFKLGILAYNQGPGVVRDYLAGESSMSIDYYNKVLKSYYELKKMAKEKFVEEAMR